MPDLSSEAYDQWNQRLMDHEDKKNGFEEDEKDQESRICSLEEANSLIASFDWIKSIIKDFHQLRKTLQMLILFINLLFLIQK